MRKVLLAVIALALASSTVFAQDVPAPATGGVSFSASSEAVAFYKNGVWTAGNDTTEALQFATFGAKKGSSLNFIGKQIIAGDWTAYLGGFRYQPDISGFIGKHTLLPADKVSVAFNAAVGPTLIQDKNMVTWLGGGQICYGLNKSGTLQWNAYSVDYMRQGNDNIVKMSMGLQYFFRRAGS